MTAKCFIPNCGKDVVWISPEGGMCRRHYQIFADNVVEATIVKESGSYFGKAILEYPKTKAKTVELTIAAITQEPEPNIQAAVSFSLLEISSQFKKCGLGKRDTMTAINILERILYLASARAMQDAISEN